MNEGRKGGEKERRTERKKAPKTFKNEIQEERLREQGRNSITREGKVEVKKDK